MQVGAKLRKQRESREWSLEYVAARANMSAGQLSRLELGTRNLDLSDYVKLCEILGVLPGDLLPNSGSAPVHLQAVEPIAEMLMHLTEEQREAFVYSFRVQLSTVAPFLEKSNVVAFPQPERTVPRMTEEFPVEPADFIEGDFDYPLELHALEVEEFEIAAGGTGVNPEVDMAAYTLHAKDVRDASHRVVKVKGDSMEPDYGEGWKLLVDTRKREPQRGDPVAVYLNDQGSVLGYWNPTRDHVELEKANRSYKPVRLGDPGTWHLIGTVQKVVDAPAKRKKR